MVACLDILDNILLTGESGYDSDTLLWDLNTGQIVQRFSEHDGGILSVSFSPDGLFYATLGSDGYAHIVEVATGDIVGRTATGYQNTALVRVVFGPRVRDPRGFMLAQYYLLGLQSDGQLVRLVYTPKSGAIDRTPLVQVGAKR